MSYWVRAERPGDGDGDDDGACLLRWMLACSLASLVRLLACLLARAAPCLSLPADRRPWRRCGWNPRRDVEGTPGPPLGTGVMLCRDSFHVQYSTVL